MGTGFATILLTAVALANPGEASRTELGFVPLVGGDSDIGLGFGFLTSVARLAPAVRPYRWRLEAAAFFTFKKPANMALQAPYQDAFVLATIPGLASGRLRIELRPSFTRETSLRYTGVGNAACAPQNEVPARDFYRRVHPAIAARARVEIGGGLHALAGGLLIGNAIDYEPESTLARDLASADPRLRALVLVRPRFFQPVIEGGLGLDWRDDEIAPSRGQHHTVKVRASPGSALPYVQLSLITRWYFPVVPARLVLAVRQVADGLFGDVPFFELGRFVEDASAIGGANGVRGVPADRYLGKRKLFGNFELRWTMARFSIRASPYALGATGFVDLGRVWADAGAAPELDGAAIGLKGGAGGGLRVQKGRTFVIRADVAWSPDARPVGGYFLAGQLF